MRYFSLMAATFLAALGLNSPAQAADCGPLKQAISLNMQTGPAGLRMLVPVTINGVPKQFLLDTGGTLTTISRRVVDQMGLRVETSRTTIYDMKGNAGSGAYVSIDIGVGTQTIKGFQSLVLPDANFNLDGIFAPDLMTHYDIEMDFAGRKLNYFLTDHCEGKVIYWPATSLAIVPFNGWVEAPGHASAHMTIPVTLDGHEITATVDTGATRSTLNDDTARFLFNLTPESAGAVPMGTMDGNPDHKVFGWTFKKLAIGDIIVTNPNIAIIPNLVGKKTQDTLTADSHVRRVTDNMGPDILIGMDVLKKLHLYIAYQEHKLYVTPANASAPAPAAQSASSGQ